jgi:threonyl-tRNA synthetase
MLHRAILGSIERFLGILIEQHAGAMPAWLAPEQVVVATIVTDANDYANDVALALRNAGLRAEVDLRNEKIGYKVREHSVQKVPAILCIGKREAEEGTVAVRRFGSKEQSVVRLEDFIEQFTEEVNQRVQ